MISPSAHSTWFYTHCKTYEHLLQHCSHFIQPLLLRDKLERWSSPHILDYGFTSLNAHSMWGLRTLSQTWWSAAQVHRKELVLAPFLFNLYTADFRHSVQNCESGMWGDDPCLRSSSLSLRGRGWIVLQAVEEYDPHSCFGLFQVRKSSSKPVLSSVAAGLKNPASLSFFTNHIYLIVTAL